jgi:flagellar motor switch protein FliN/FliY
MPSLSAQVEQFSSQQPAIWQAVSVQVSEKAGAMVTFGTPLVTTGIPSEVLAELMTPSAFVQFHFANSPENPQIILLPNESALEFAAALLDKDLEGMNDDILQEIRPNIEAIVQGLCVGLSNVRNEPFIASGLSVRYQIVSFPPNVQGSESVVKTSLAWEIGESRGTAIWIIDPPTLCQIAGLPMSDTVEELFASASSPTAFPTAGSSALAPEAAGVEPGLEILLDIPLDISVELGRMKMPVKDILEMGAGSIVELDRVAGEPIDVLVNGRVVARGEVVVIEDNFGVRVTEILTPIERLKRLGERE